MVRVTRVLKQIARESIAPVLLRLLNSYTAEEFAAAVDEKQNLVDWLNENGDTLQNMRILVAMIPFADKAGDYFRSKPWIRWFVKNELHEKRPDLYIVVMYHPGAFKWMCGELKRISDFLFYL